VSIRHRGNGRNLNGTPNRSGEMPAFAGMTAIRTAVLEFLARSHMPQDPVDQAPFFGRRGRDGRRRRFGTAAKQRAARRNKRGEAHGGLLSKRGVPPAPLWFWSLRRW